MDQVLAYYTNRMNLACGENMKMNSVPQTGGTTADTNALPTLTAIANIALNNYSAGTTANAAGNEIYYELKSASDVYDFLTAKQVVNAGLTNSPLTQNAFLSSAQMATMQEKYKTGGAKVFILRDSARCFIVPVATMTAIEQSAVANANAACIAQ